MFHRSRFTIRLAIVGGLLSVLVLGSPALAVAPVNTGLFNSLAIYGFDPVAYFEDGGPAKGSGKWSHDWNGATWRFTSAAHRDLFVAEPERYAPQYGGYCAYAVSKGTTAKIDPNAWKIVDGKLYLNYNKSIQKDWEEDIPGRIAAADKNWPKILEE